MPSYRSILVVEDDRKARESLTRNFLSRGNLVIAVAHPRQAMEAVTVHDFDVAIINQSLPELSGVSLIPRLRGLVRDLGVVLLSEDPDDITSEEAIDQGADAFLHKPCCVDDVEAGVQKALAPRRQTPPAPVPRTDNRWLSTGQPLM